MTQARILVVEDRGIIADKIERVLRSAGHEVLALAPTLAAALNMADAFAGQLDLAVLDIDLRGEPAYPLVEVLESRAVPFLFVTGYGARAIDARWSNVVRVEKPFETATLLRAVGDVLCGQRPRPAAVAPGRSPTPTPAIRKSWELIRETRDIVTDTRAYRELLGRPSKF